jgi:arylsulfatase A-like enzyme
MDHQLQRLFSALEAQGLLENAIVIFVGDHGEMFAETRPFPLGHGFDVDLWVSRVPLFWVGTGSEAQSPRRVDASVKVSDLAPTLLAQLGLPDPGMGSGQDLQPLLRGEALETDPIFLEATKARAKPYEAGWNNLMKERGVIHEGHVLFRHPGRSDQSGLFRVDAKQTPVEDPGREKALARMLTAWDAKAPGHRTETMDAETKEALRALGYIE